MNVARAATLAAALMSLASAAAAAPCLLGPDDKPVSCPGAATPPTAPPAARAAVPAGKRGLLACVNPKTKAPMKCPPAMMTPAVSAN